MEAMTFDAVCRRAGGRRAYNKQRNDVMRVRRFYLLIALMQCQYAIDTRWIEAQAGEYGVSLDTLYRDLRSLNVRHTQAVRAAAWEAALGRARAKGRV